MDLEDNVLLLLFLFQLRGCMFFIGFGIISISSYLVSTYVDPRLAPRRAQAEVELKVNDAEAAKKLFYNRFGAPSRPLKSLEDMMTFLGGSATYD